MATDPAAGSGSKDTSPKDTSPKDIPWETYVADARRLILATASAGPVAMQVWAKAWCSWVTSVTRTHDQLARGWLGIVENPGQGATALDRMREDCKQYFLEIGTIPERAAIEFLQTMSERGGRPAPPPSSPEQQFSDAADGVVAAAADVLSQVSRTIEYGQRQARKAGAEQATPPPGLAEFRASVEQLTTARTKLGRPPGNPSR
jgi:hypothetical protein